jgi:hypothetical protein
MKVDITHDIARTRKRAATRNALHRSLRVFLGALMLATGVGKALDIPGFGEVIATYRLGLADELLVPIAFAIAAVELALGGWLLAGRRLAVAARVSIALNVAYAALLTSALWRGLALDNCGCFGVYLPSPLRWYSPLESLALAGASYLLLRLSHPFGRSGAALPS